MELLEATIKARDGTSQVDKDSKPPASGTYVQTLGSNPSGLSQIGLGLGYRKTT